MREIKFRGKRVDNGEWVYGYFVEGNMSKSFIVQINYLGQLVDCDEVIPKTAGQCTGLKDKNGKKIYEEDIVKTKYGFLVVIEWYDGGYIYSNDHLPEKLKKEMSDSHFVACNFCCSEDELIGNIHQNPELLK